MNAQLRFAERLLKVKKSLGVTSKQLPMKREINLPLSTEMVDWLQGTFEDTSEDGDFTDPVTSVLAKPLDSMSVYCPLGAIASSKNTSLRTVANPLRDLTDQFRFTNTGITGGNDKTDEISGTESVISGQTSMAGNSVSTSTSTWALNKPPQRLEKALPVNHTVNRLEVMWLQRRAKFEREDGNLEESYNTLSEALSLHLGTDKYESANLAEHNHTDPTALFDYVNDTYFLYDDSAHLTAARIQRCFLRRHRRRCRSATHISRYFRGYLARKSHFQRHQLRKQCCQIIQRRFRIHLRRMHMLATKVKMWYVSLKQQAIFKVRMFYYRKARKIQAWVRGILGRAVANQKRLELNMTSMVQRHSRGFNSRRKRELALRYYHKAFFLSARIIQCFFRRVLAISRSQYQLLYELAREEDRLEREKDVIEETIRVQIAKTRLYMVTEAGKLHLQQILNRIRLKDAHFRKIKKTLSEVEIMSQEAMVSFELFDSDGSGLIDEDELFDMLKQLCIPMTKTGVAMLAADISKDGEGEIDFGDFMDWYCGGGGEEAADVNSLEDQIFKQILKARHAVMELTGQILVKRGEREMLRQCTTWLTKDITATFRLAHPPKFQCCQCQSPFVLFTDYYAHFNPQGFCSVLNQKAMFFPKFWIKRDWNYQRQCEHEVMRINDEIPCINYNSLIATYADLALQNDTGVAALINKHVKAAQLMFAEKLGKIEYKKTMGETMKETINICNDNFLSPIVAKCVADALRRKMPDKWTLDDHWDLNDFSDWLTEVVDKDIAINKGLFVCFASQKLKLNAWLLGNNYVRVIRLLQVSAEASLAALMETRMRRSRRFVPHCIINS